MLSVTQLACTRGDRTLFAGLNFQLEAGQVLRVHGSNGCGKTSLLQLLCGIGLPESGEICWQQQSIHQDANAYLSQLAYLGHALGVKRELTPVENLEFSAALCAQRADLSIDDALQKMKMLRFADQLCLKLSAGQQRRVALARLLLGREKLWILDEPYSALDIHGQALLNELIQSHIANGGLLILTAHHAVELGGVPVQILDLEATAHE